MNIETSQASRSKHELHVEHEQNLILLSLWSRSDNTLTSCCELITWNARQLMASLLSNMTSLLSIMTRYPVGSTTHMILGTYQWTWV